jgi:hypothetical protein
MKYYYYDQLKKQAEHVVHMLENLKERDQLRERGLGGRIILKFLMNKLNLGRRLVLNIWIP